MEFMKKNWIFIFPIGLLIVSFILLPWLPDEMPMQFDMSGDVNWTMSKYIAIWMIPAVELFIILYNWAERSTIKVMIFMLILTAVEAFVFLSVL